MRWIITALLSGYWIGFLGIFFIEANVGPVTPGLAGLRALVWPYYLATGRPRGERARIIGEEDE